MRMLDVATGPGYAAARGAERGAAVVGVDIAEAMVTLAGRRHPQLDFRVGNAEALPFPDSSFDAVVGNFAMLHLARPEAAAAEFFRVLAPGGRLALTVWDVPSGPAFLVCFSMPWPRREPSRRKRSRSDRRFRFSDEQEFARLLRDQRLEGIRVETIAFWQTVSSPDELWRGLLAGTVRTSALIQRQTDEMQRQVHAAFDRVVQPYRVGDRLELPVSVKLASATKPIGTRTSEGVGLTRDA